MESAGTGLPYGGEVAPQDHSQDGSTLCQVECGWRYGDKRFEMPTRHRRQSRCTLSRSSFETASVMAGCVRDGQCELVRKRMGYVHPSWQNSSASKSLVLDLCQWSFWHTIVTWNSLLATYRPDLLRLPTTGCVHRLPRRCDQRSATEAPRCINFRSRGGSRGATMP